MNLDTAHPLDSLVSIAINPLVKHTGTQMQWTLTLFIMIVNQIKNVKRSTPLIRDPIGSDSMDASIVEQQGTSAKNALNPLYGVKIAIGLEKIIRRSAQGIIRSEPLTPMTRKKPK
jgi:hypothetical protein